MHERLLSVLENVADVKLVCRLQDSRLGFANPKDMRVFIPDLHLISEERLQDGDFQFSTNCEGLLVQVLRALKDLQGQIKPDEKLTVTHLGDILDLWRETGGLDPTVDVAARIANDHGDLINALRDPGLGTTVFLGNHDYELHLWASYAGSIRKLFIPEGKPQVLVLHGDVFDWIEKLPEELKNLGVYSFSPDLEPNDYQLGQMYPFVKSANPNPNNPTWIRLQSPAPLGSVGPATSEELPTRVNVQIKGAGGPVHEFLDLAYDYVQKANSNYGLNIKTVIIGHTHHARIAVQQDNGDLFTLVDCGAWIENCRPDGSSNGMMPNAQIAALCGNDVRIYQLLDLQDSVPNELS